MFFVSVVYVKLLGRDVMEQIKKSLYNQDIVFTKKHTQIAKGIAILLMVYHHLYVIPERLNYDYYALPNIFGYE